MDFWYGMDSKYTRFLRECNEIVEAIWRWDSALYDVCCNVSHMYGTVYN
jgi:hypothetical protein